jgi:hypothetical protein
MVCSCFLAAKKKGRGWCLVWSISFCCTVLPVHEIHFYFVDVRRYWWQLDWIWTNEQGCLSCPSRAIQNKQKHKANTMQVHLCHESRTTGEIFELLEVAATMVAAVCILFEFISSPFILRKPRENVSGTIAIAIAVVSEIEA